MRAYSGGSRGHARGVGRPRRFRVGKVTVFFRAESWVLRYRENGRDTRVRIGADRDVAARRAAEVNAHRHDRSAVEAVEDMAARGISLVKKWRAQENQRP